jgi:DNA-binding transcriptional MerR regulator
MPDDAADANIPDRLFFRIGEAAQLVGVEPHVLRYWETEFRVRPQRSSTGQRMYRRKDISRLLRIKRLLHDEGFTIAGARKALAEASPEGPPSVVTEEDPPAPPVDNARLREASDRLAEAHTRLAALRRRVGTAGVAGRGTGS